MRVQTPHPRPSLFLKLVKMVQYMWEIRYIPNILGWTILVFIPKVRRVTQGIGLLEVIWKLVEAAIDTIIKVAVEFHDVLNGFWAVRGTGTAISKIKLEQELARV